MHHAQCSFYLVPTHKIPDKSFVDSCKKFGFLPPCSNKATPLANLLLHCKETMDLGGQQQGKKLIYFFLNVTKVGPHGPNVSQQVPVGSVRLQVTWLCQAVFDEENVGIPMGLQEN